LPIGARQSVTQAIAPSAPRKPNSLLQAAGQLGNKFAKDLAAHSAADAVEETLGVSVPTRPSMSSTIYPLLKKAAQDGLSAAGEVAVSSGLASDLQENYMHGNDPGA
jgi:hypothetical protein